MIYVGFGLVLYLNQQAMLYYPTPEILHDFKEEIFASGGESLKVIIVNADQENAALYFGGNAESVAMSASEFAREIPHQALYLVNYRGYGGSTGTPSEAGLYADALAIFDEVRTRHGKVAVIGRSLGTGIATLVAAERPVKKLILVSPYDSILNIVRQRFPVYPASLMLRDHYDSMGRAPRIQADTIILMAENDQVIERTRTENLIAALKPRLLGVHELGGTSHNSISNHREYYPLLRDFLAN